MESNRIVVESPMSFAGSAKRIWRVQTGKHAVVRWLLLIPLAVLLIGLAWTVVAGWYVLFGLLVVPYRLVRRGSRKRRLEDARHRELLSARHHSEQ